MESTDGGYYLREWLLQVRYPESPEYEKISGEYEHWWEPEDDTSSSPASDTSSSPRITGGSSGILFHYDKMARWMLEYVEENFKTKMSIIDTINISNSIVGGGKIGSITTGLKEGKFVYDTTTNYMEDKSTVNTTNDDKYVMQEASKVVKLNKSANDSIDIKKTKILENDSIDIKKTKDLNSMDRGFKIFINSDSDTNITYTYNGFYIETLTQTAQTAPVVLTDEVTDSKGKAQGNENSIIDYATNKLQTVNSKLINSLIPGNGNSHMEFTVNLEKSTRSFDAGGQVLVGMSQQNDSLTAGGMSLYSSLLSSPSEYRGALLKFTVKMILKIDNYINPSPDIDLIYSAGGGNVVNVNDVPGIGVKDTKFQTLSGISIEGKVWDSPT